MLISIYGNSSLQQGEKMSIIAPIIIGISIFVVTVMAVPLLFAIIGYCFYNWPLRMSFLSHIKDEYGRAYFFLTS